MRTGTRTTGLRRIVFVCVVLGLTLALGSASVSRASEGLNDAVNWTLTVRQAYRDAVKEVAKKAAAVKALEAALKFVYETQFDSAMAKAKTTAAAIAALGRARQNLVKAQAAMALAKKVAGPVAVGALAFLAGTGYYQLAWKILDCLNRSPQRVEPGQSPLLREQRCNLVSSGGGAGPIYVPISDADLDAALPELLELFTGETFTKQDFEASPAGLVAWDFMREPIRLFIDAARGAAAFKGDRPNEVEAAAIDLQRVVERIPGVILQAADALVTTRVIPPVTDSGRTVPEDIRAALDDVNAAIAAIQDPPPGDETTCTQPPCDNSDALNVAWELRDVLEQAFEIVTQLSYPEGSPLGGSPRVLNDFFRPSTRLEFRTFALECRVFGRDCLPEPEVLVGERLLELAGVDYPTFLDDLAALDGAAWGPLPPIGSEEAALFDDHDPVSQAEFYRVSATILSPGGSWLGMEFAKSPLLHPPLECNGQITQVDTPAATFYVDDRDVLSSGGGGVWIYQESNGIKGLQSGGSSIVVPEDFDLCTDEAVTPDTLIY